MDVMHVRQPWKLNHPGRIVIIGDVHGDTERLLFCLQSLGIISQTLEWIANPPHTIVVQLGDQVDSASRVGEYEWEDDIDVNVLFMTDHLDTIAMQHGGRFISLIGNHEMMNVLGMFNYVSQKSLMVTGVEGRKELFQRGTGVCCKILAKRNVVVQIGPYLFCHGGLVLKHLEQLYGDINGANTLVQRFLRGDEMISDEYAVLNSVILSPEGILWTRQFAEHANDAELLGTLIEPVLRQTNAICMFVGHNTVDNIQSICDNRIFLTDAGFSRAYATKQMHVIEIKHNTTIGTDEVNVITIRE
jgi:hypothetical protein